MKRKLENFSDKFLNSLENQGLTYSEMMQDHNLTRWGARKLGEHKALQEEKAGKEKIFYVDTRSDLPLSMKLPVEAEEPNQEEETRQGQKAKQSVTREANTYLKELEHEVKNTDTPETSYEAPEYSGNGFTAIIHETDSHFSAHVKDRKGKTVYNTDIAKQATHDAFAWYRQEIVNKATQQELDEIVLLLGGDLVEGETIYEGQAHEITDTLEKQIEAARRTYFEELKLLAGLGVPVKVVCISGNHGDLPVSSSSNADDLIYSMLEDMADISGLEDVKFVRTDRSDGLLFNYRNWKGYLCHGENRSNHIGTSSPQSDWYAMKDQYGFDAAWRGHHHVQKREDVSGAPVYMTNSRKPGDDYTDTLATFGETGNAIYFATDDEPVSEVKTQTGVLD